MTNWCGTKFLYPPGGEGEVGSCTGSLICQSPVLRSCALFFSPTKYFPFSHWIFLLFVFSHTHVLLQPFKFVKLETFPPSEVKRKKIIQIMEFLQTPENQILVGAAVAVVAIVAGAFYLYSSKKSKGLIFFPLWLLFFVELNWLGVLLNWIYGSLMYEVGSVNDLSSCWLYFFLGNF